VSYVVLARKWRPLCFEDLVGQEHVSRTLGNAIQTGRVAHAFLFTGVRGVGKTTSARILAKALNCLGDPATTPPGTDPGPTVTPCLKCAACLEIATGTDVDVWEIDGASYNGIDEVRKLQDSLPYRPQRDRYKIFIVDEVHMLSQSAWNAFLKTLEEPPPHVKFIFATTEVHKVPVTILSRVQRFDFKLIAAHAIAARLKHVLGVEGIAADDAAIALIAREAAGSMRDAMSLLDQVIAWGGAELRGEEVAQVLGVASRSALHALAAALVAGNPERCLSLVLDLAEQGYDLVHVARDLLAMLRDLVVGKVCTSPDELLDLPAEEQKDVVTLAAGAALDDLLRLHQGFSQGYDDVARSGQPRAALEMLLVRLARRPPLLPLDELLGRLGALERRLTSGTATPARERAAAPRAEAMAPAAPAAPPFEVPEPFETSAAAPTAAAAPSRTAAAPALPTNIAVAAPSRAPAPARSPSAAPANPSSVAPLPAPSPRTSPSARPASGPRLAASAAPAFVVPDFSDVPEPATAARPAPVRAVPPAPPAVATEAHAALRAIVERLPEDRYELRAFLARAAPLEAGPGALVLGFAAGEPFVAKVERELPLIERIASEHFTAPTRVSVERDSERVGPIATLATLDAEEEERQRRAALAKVRNHPRVTEAVEVLGARVKDLKLSGQ
jgi:DNA polymerase-3 subunit gamma/tau